MKKNIIIITNNYDESANNVIDWIAFAGGNVIRLLSEDLINYHSLFSFEFSKLLYSFKIGSIVNSNNICSIWIRKGSPENNFNVDFVKDEKLKNQISRHLFAEVNEAKLSFVNFLEHNYHVLGTIPSIKLDKISQLLAAKQIGLNVPATIITNSKVEVKKFKKTYQTIIAKCVNDSTFIRHNGDSYGQYTEIIENALIDQLPEYFIPNIVQQCLDKHYDIRCFYLDEKIYSMAILMFNKTENNIDYRKDYLKNNIRYLPFKLPKTIEKKLILYMKAINLNTGSIDIVKTTDNQYYFIEVNPSGQYGMLSTSCNYYLDEKIANYLYK